MTGAQERAAHTAPGVSPGVSQAVDDLLYRAWTIICNVSDGDWTQQSVEWRASVHAYRDSYHDWLNRTTRAS